MPIPTVEEVGRISSLVDPVVRNLQITQCYYELSQALAGVTGNAANWCAFATWASKQAGQTIRGEDLARTVEDVFRRSPEAQALLDDLLRAAERLGRKRDGGALRQDLLRAFDLRAALRRSADAVARGNLRVFEEIGREFARFLATFGVDVAYDGDKTAQFCGALRPGDPPEGQRLLREAFTAYCDARFEVDPKTRAELIYCANLLVGLHEQTRLQPEIKAALDAAFEDTEAVRQRLLRVILPGFWLRIRLRISHLLQGRLPLDEALDRVIDHVRKHVRRVVTDALLTLHLSDGRTLRLGQDLETPFPPVLAQATHPKLQAVLAQVDATPDSTLGSGARDWADLPDRMHFITDFFRCYHAWEPLFDAPFTAAQVAHLKAGRRPEGPL